MLKKAEKMYGFLSILILRSESIKTLVFDVQTFRKKILLVSGETRELRNQNLVASLTDKGIDGKCFIQIEKYKNSKHF